MQCTVCAHSVSDMDFIDQAVTMLFFIHINSTKPGYHRGVSIGNSLDQIF